MTPYQIPNVEITDDAPWTSRKFHYHLAKPMLSKRMAAQRDDRGDGQERTALKDELAQLSHLFEERANEVVTLTKELSSKKVAAKIWAAEKASLLSERDEAQVCYLELQRAKDADLKKANQALEQAIKEKNEALVSAASSRVQFATQKIREFPASPNYDSKIHTECTAYLYYLASDHKSRFPDLVTLFGEEKADKPEWYGDLSFSDSGSSDEEAAKGVEACSSDRNPVIDS
ncbi:hypothetical protein LIER_08798 [Lithospermum erythrorhizon]|uniref:Uncharacterized protein n=1 Tax=Lithospermum erythrorhizon TaxID=34254 RepID=A0AAV3PDG2_LITER